jgi:protein phosphatase PTC7
VADGVGGWNSKGVDPGIFARELCSHVWNDYRKLRVEDGLKCYDIDLKKLLIGAVAKTKAMGTSTFVMAMLEREEAVLKTLNLGDSGFLIVRPKQETPFELLFRSKEQQYRFNYPYQCGTNYEPPTHADCHVHIV